MFEVYWERIMYTRADKVCFEHTVYEGRFLSEEVYVYCVRLKGANVKSLKCQLDILLNCSHQRLNKLYYYTLNADNLLIFTEKIHSLSSLDLKSHLDKKVCLA